MGRSNRNTPKAGSNRAEKLARRREAQAAASVSARPFEGLAAEGDLVAMREFVPSATAPLAVKGTDRTFFVATVLPGAVNAIVREEGDDVVAYVALQSQSRGSDPATDLAGSIEWAVQAKVGESLARAQAGTKPLAELIDADQPLEITVHDTFEWWFNTELPAGSEAAVVVERANAAIMPSARVEGLDAAWWVDAGEKAHIRWVRKEDEDALMLALARVHAAGGLTLGEGSRYAGSFRTDGLLVPVFDLDRTRAAQDWAAATAEFGERLEKALASTDELTVDERRARDGLRGRQITLR